MGGGEEVLDILNPFDLYDIPRTHFKRCKRSMTLGGHTEYPLPTLRPIFRPVDRRSTRIFNLIKQSHCKHRAADTQSRWAAANNNNNNALGPFESI